MYPRDSPIYAIAGGLSLNDLSVSIDLGKKNIKRRRAKIPTASSLKKPQEVRPIWEALKARNNVEKRPASLPPKSLPKKYMSKHVNYCHDCWKDHE